MYRAASVLSHALARHVLASPSVPWVRAPAGPQILSVSLEARASEPRGVRLHPARHSHGVRLHLASHSDGVSLALARHVH
jgi:hypothetical protein